MPDGPGEGVLALGHATLDLARGTLTRDGEVLALRAKSYRLLCELARQPGRVVPKSELLDAVWPDVIVTEASLSQAVRDIRRALGDEGGRILRTVSRRGFMLCPGGPGAGAAPPDDLPRVAVRPFEVLGGGADDGWFAAGVAEDIATALARFQSLVVLGRGAAAGTRGAPPAAARYVVEGSVRRAGDRLRIAAGLVDGATGAQLWSRRFDGTLGELFEFQDRITETVATLVEPRITLAETRRSVRERPDSLAVHDITLRALALILTETEPDNAAARALLAQGLALAPDDPRLLAYAAWVIEHRTTMGWPPFGPDDRQTCADFARRGLERARGDAAVMSSCGMSLLQGGRDYDLGMAAIEAAVGANPNDLLVVIQAGVAHLHCGDLDQALGHFHRAARLGHGDPATHFAFCGIADVHLIRGEPAEALARASRALAMNPNFDPTLWVLIAANAHLGRLDEARRLAGELRRLRPGVTVAAIRAGQPARDPNRTSALLDGLRRAGLPEG